ncbi:hypothetical protein PP182_00140 [Maribacter sp. PR1]|uniref:Uncharacterized protein n=1 Tax=Maribacter cobaltidurans TaxID=1178778 RepID=A0ABU7INJ8_9FLAO|nr:MULTISPECIES: hypothetical protein [Maribacter]MDC6387073.1 hypothetical protein [Maribacter sp. PR1]MEE1974459.1 hypothetical protein [Maribacter cobaltidurans]
MYQDIIDFLQRSYFVIAYGITLILSIITYQKYFDTQFKYLPAILAYTLLNEILGYFIRYYPEFSFFPNLKDARVNEIIYNLYDLIFFPFFYYAYWKLIENETYKKWIKTLGISAMLSFAISCLFQNPMYTTLYYANAIASWVLLICIVLYFKDKQKTHKTISQPYNLVFWVSIGLFLFHIFSPFLFLIGYLRYDLWLAYNLKNILHFLIIMMYLSFCIGFIINRKKAFG